ncbi:RNA polymerase subunit sigma-70 [Nodosilinea sp. LEGE 07088]|uniref:RNA polymerase sigma factor n=1 Tax=Nodosilinea sp. LEGE 07088 TaxID=2777968 RepID=UPI00187E1D78|nr:DUF6596 domain-containing protein [Nodosilinea sp. LEGE 07088]MBE9140182.1 RNA polymerase subunit sigma-70 [Nodosilinea sp. LEGE 07088]
MDARRAAELAARNSYGRLVAYLAAQTRDLAAAEDALGDAFLKALSTWPEQGTPTNPEAWLLVTARRRWIDTARRSQTQEQVFNALTVRDAVVASVSDSVSDSDGATFPDDRLKLLFICAHPAIDGALHTPLMLQTVLGLNAAQIASAFLVAPTTMGQRLVRAKAKIRDAGIAFELPMAEDLPERLDAVLAAIYAAYTQGWETVDGADPRDRGFAEEALWLARLCVQLMPQAAEARGLLALMLYCEARRDARRNAQGGYVPLDQQDTRRWSQAMIAAAEHELAQAASLSQLGRFQLEAAIQSIHAQRLRGAAIDWDALVLLYEGLIQLSPTLGALVSQAAAIAETKGPEQGLALLNTLPAEAIANYQPYWALKAHLLQRLNQAAAKEAYQRAIGLSEDAAIRDFLLARSQD